MMRRNAANGSGGMARLPWILSGLLAGALMAMSLMHGPLSSMSERSSDKQTSAVQIVQLQEKISRLTDELEKAKAATSKVSSSVEAPKCTDIIQNPEESILDPELASLLQAAAAKSSSGLKEVMIALTNDVMMCTNPKTCWWNGGNILKDFLDLLAAVKVENYIIVALDDNTATFLKEYGAKYIRMEPETTAQDGTRGANQVSALKFGLLTKILRAGYSVLITDLDIVYTTDPFALSTAGENGGPPLHRDSDVEVSTDGFSKDWASGKFAGISDPEMGWGGGGLYFQVFTTNVGCMFARPTYSAISLMDRMAERLRKDKGWDQQIWNEELLFPAYGTKTRSSVSLRVMDHHIFANSKTFFRSSRSVFLPGSKATNAPKPVMLHANYHADKHKRQLCWIARYLNGTIDACDALPIGS